MALNPADWKITRGVTNDIEYIGPLHDGSAGTGGYSGTPTYAPVIEFHRWLQGLADDAVASGNDELDITSTLPSQRSTDNIITLINTYNIDDATSQHLYDGSIIQNGGDDIYDGIVNFGNADVQISIIQNGAALSGTSAWWNQSGAGLNADATSGISHRFMINTRTGATDVDNRKLIGTCRRFNYTYSEFTINATARGNNVLALTDSSDLNNTTSDSTVATWSAGFTNTEGYDAIDVDNNGTPEYYYSEWDIDKPTYDINDFYEYMKYLSRDGTASTLYGLSGELFRGITHQVTYNTLAGGTFADGISVSWGTGATAGTGQILADNGATAMWIQILTGVAPSGGVTLTQGAVTASFASVLERTISKPFCGASTGSALIGAYGVGVVATDLASNDSVIDLANEPPISPPNYVTNSVIGVVSGEDRILVAPWDGSSVDSNGDKAINKNQLTLTSTLNSADVATIQVSNGDETAIPADTPATGVIRVTDDDGYERWIPYSSWAGTTFTVDTTNSTGLGPIGNNNDFNGTTGSGTYQATAGNNVYIAYIDILAPSTSASFTSIKSTGSRNLVLLVRDGGGTPIKQYIAPWTLTSSSTSTTVIRTSDT